jgi:hypothetical protein
MMVVGLRRELRRQMTLRADRVPGRSQLLTVGLVTIAAGHPGLEHTALGERSPYENFVFDLSVRMVEAPRQQSRHEVVQEVRRRFVSRRDLASA